ncbi:MAG: hypothetical protein ACYCPQ_04415 [Elusimicrobiota bacterium]
MKSIVTILALFIAAGTEFSAYAAPQTQDNLIFSQDEILAAKKNPKEFTIDPQSITIKKIAVDVHPQSMIPTGSVTPTDILPDLSQIINLGLKIWNIIEQNKPVVDIATQYASALPKGLTGWTDLGGWHEPEGVVYEMSAKNFYGAKVIDVKYEVLRSWGGNYNGKGRYLTEVTVEPLNVQADWGYKLSISANVPQSGIINVGSSQNPVAGMTLESSWRIDTAIKTEAGRSVYYLQGDGLLREADGFSPDAIARKTAKALTEIHF